MGGVDSEEISPGRREAELAAGITVEDAIRHIQLGEHTSPSHFLCFFPVPVVSGLAWEILDAINVCEN